MKFVAIRSYDNYVPAHIDMGLLKQGGIESWLKDEHSVTVNPIFTNAVGGIKLMVPELQAEEAMNILIRERAAYIGTLGCPHCGSDQFRAVEIPAKPSYWLEKLLAFFLGPEAMGKEKIYYCSNCRNQFKEPVSSNASELNIPD